ncbi:MAG TPA: DUF58 domain-containing protein [Candidatus Limnocylindria bacterium]|nr:DUF58 domain-containing protein [Candidatus Limnocylindria bacterium]
MRPWHFAVLWVGLFIAAVSSGVELLSYLAYLLLFVGVAMWITARLTLEGLSVKRTVGQAYAHLGDRIDLNYELRNDHRLGKLWVEVSETSNWPEPLTGRVLSIAGKGAVRRWRVSVPALRRGRFHLGPIVLRSGDPFGLFATVARIPLDALVLVYPKVLPLPFWQLPGSFLEGNVLTGQRSLQSTSMVMGIRDYRPGDAVNRIHWPSSVRHRGLFVKEFELDKTADLWIYLDLERHWHRGEGEMSTEERAVTVAASVVAKALREHRNVGLVTTGVRAEILHPDRGTKQFGKLMQYLAEVSVGGSRTIAEVMVETLPRLRRGASVLLITPSLDRAWVRPASTFRESSISTQAVLVGSDDTDERDRARRHALLGELVVAGVKTAHLQPHMNIEDLFHETMNAIA